MRMLSAVAVLLCASALAHDGPHPDDPVKRAEHTAAINLVNPETATVATGRSSGLTVTPDSVLYVPEGAELLVDSNLDVRRIRADGAVTLVAVPLTIRVETLVTNTTGRLTALASTASRRIVLKARGLRDRDGDATDVSGGIVLHSKQNVLAGEPKTSVAQPASIDAVAERLTFSIPVDNWRAGDRIVIPGVTWVMPDEVVTVSSVSADRKTVGTSPITVDHVLPDGSFPAVGNLTRSLTIESESTELTQRGHVMIMHEHTGTEISHVAFRNLGRTSVESTPTKITLGPEGEFISGDANTIGRYPLHFHGRSGADPAIAAHRVSGCVIEGSPSHGLVNHGSHVSAQMCVAYDCGGSNLLGENGLELGDFSWNLAVLSRGRQATTTIAQRNAEFAAFNFGWEGTALWLQGPGVRVIGNHLYRAKRALLATQFRSLPDAGDQFSYPVAYMPSGPQKTAVQEGRFGHSKVVTGFHQVPSYFEGNVGAGAVVGFEMVESMYDTKSIGDGVVTTKHYAGQRTQVIGHRFYNVDRSMGGTYIGHVDVRGGKFWGNLKLTLDPASYVGTFQGTKVHDVSYIDCEFRRFQIGVVDRGWSDFDVIGCTFEENLIDVSVICKSTTGEPHPVKIERCRHLGRSGMASLYATKNPKTVWGQPRDFWFHEQDKERATLFDANVFRVAPHTLDGRLLYYPSNASTYVPFDTNVSDATGLVYGGLSNHELWTNHGKAVMGRLFDPASADYERLSIDANIPVMSDKLTEPPPDPDPPTLEERVDALRRDVDELKEAVRVLQQQ